MGKFTRQQTDDIFSYFSKKKGFDISCKMSYGDNLHKMSKPIY